MKPITRAKVTYFKWTVIMFIPVIIMTLIQLLACPFNNLYFICDWARGCVEYMIDYREYRTHVAFNGYELTLRIK